jgi:hypothetical protein
MKVERGHFPTANHSRPNLRQIYERTAALRLELRLLVHPSFRLGLFSCQSWSYPLAPPTCGAFFTWRGGGPAAVKQRVSCSRHAEVRILPPQRAAIETHRQAWAALEQEVTAHSRIDSKTNFRATGG